MGRFNAQAHVAQALKRRAEMAKPGKPGSSGNSCAIDDDDAKVRLASPV